MSDLWTTVDRYFVDRLHPADPALDAVLASAQAAGMPAIHVSAAQGRLLAILAASIGARSVLEIGTLAGYSTIWLARALPEGGRVITIESDELHARVARANFTSSGVARRVDLRHGLALDILDGLLQDGVNKPAPVFDLVFIDADKKSIPEYFDRSVHLTRPGGLIIVDNVVREGKVVQPDSADDNVTGVRRFVDAASRDTRVEVTAIQTVGAKGYDGFAIARVLP